MTRFFGIVIVITVRNIEKLIFEHLNFLEEKYNDFHRD